MTWFVVQAVPMSLPADENTAPTSPQRQHRSAHGRPPTAREALVRRGRDEAGGSERAVSRLDRQQLATFEGAEAFRYLDRACEAGVTSLRICPRRSDQAYGALRSHRREVEGELEAARAGPSGEDSGAVAGRLDCRGCALAGSPGVVRSPATLPAVGCPDDEAADVRADEVGH